jgi:hypothetical protein
MTDENPTELETFQILEEAHKKLNLAMDPEYAKFMHSCISGGKSGAVCKVEWDDKHKTAKMSAEMEEYTTFLSTKMKEGKTLLQAINEWTEAHKVPDESKPIIPEAIMSRLEALEKAKTEEVKVQLSATIAEVKKVDPTFDDKKFLSPFGENTTAAIMAVNTYMESVKHFKETLPEIATKMHLGSNNAAVAHRKELTMKMFGTDDITKIVKEL